MSSNDKNTKDLRLDVLEIIKGVIDSLNPRRTVREHMKVDNNFLSIGSKRIDIGEFENIYLLGAGKATATMTGELENLLGDRLTGGIIAVKKGFGEYPRRIKVIEAGHPVPDTGSKSAAEEAVALAESAGENDLIICVISGGASALWSLPADNLTMEDKIKVTESLLKCGADIYEMNTVRKHISAIKGGRLAKAAYPAGLITLAASDVVGDDISFIGSGPTVSDKSTFKDAMNVITKYDLNAKISKAVIDHIERGCTGEVPETLKEDNPIFSESIEYIIASNRQAVDAAAELARGHEYNTAIIGHDVTGEAREVGQRLADKAKQVLSSGKPVKLPAVLLAGGETTVTIQGRGKGGRNQELALSAARHISGLSKVVIASFGTDGNDGPTDAAGAIVDGETVVRAENIGLSAKEYLDNNNSYEFFSRLDDLIKTGPTGVNLMDIQVIAIGRQDL